MSKSFPNLETTMQVRGLLLSDFKRITILEEFFTRVDQYFYDGSKVTIPKNFLYPGFSIGFNKWSIPVGKNSVSQFF